MYNAFLVSKKQIQIQQMKKKSEINTRYVKRYYNVTRPALIDNHNKRINSFIRKMEQQPIQINLDPHLKNNVKQHSFRANSISQERTVSHSTARKQINSNIQNYDSSPHHQTFKFKDNVDWQSLFTPLERIQRQRNYEIFKHKFGDPTIAYRSIVSQSQYKTGHQYRDRDKSMQINPPMRYTNKPTQQVLAKMKSRYKNKQKNNKINEGKGKNLSQSKEQDAFIRKNTGSSFSGINEDSGMLSENNTDRDRGSKEDQLSERQASNQHNIKKQKKDKKPLKLHFKEIMDLEQNINDVKTKRALRDILYKCGVYRRKNRRVATDSEVDKLSQFTDMREH